MTETTQAPNCLDIIVPFNEALYADHALPEVQLMGGIASVALQHPGTEIRVDERCIVAPKGFLQDETVLEALRPLRKNGTLRDLDALVLSTDQAKIDSVEALAEQKIGQRLDISVFGLHKAAQLREQVANPSGWQVLKTFVSDRYVDDDSTIRKALFPFAVEMPPDALEPYSLEVGDHVFQTANPAAAVLNYWTRSISGLRPKDADKVQTMASRVFDKAPELVDWSIDGPGRSQMKLAAIFHTLRWANSWTRANRQLELGGALQVRAGSVRALAQDESFMLPDADANTRDGALAMALVKSRGLGIPESNDTIVKLFQTYVEPLIDTITKNTASNPKPAK